MKKDTSKKMLIVIKSVEEAGWSGGCSSGGITPLGTFNSDGILTSEHVVASATPDIGGFERVLGHTVLSFKTEPDKIDSQGISEPKDYVRGHDTYSGNIEFDKLKNNNRFPGAVDGFWSPSGLFYEPFHDFRLFEIWTLKNPVNAAGACSYSLTDIVSCDELVKHFYVILDSLDEPKDIPDKIMIPLSRRKYRRFNDKVLETAVQTAIYDDATVVPGSYSAAVQPREHTRLNLKMENLVGVGTITVFGLNILGEPVQEEFDAVDTTLPAAGVIGNVYFVSISEIVLAGMTSVDLEIYDYDWGLVNPAPQQEAAP